MARWSQRSWPALFMSARRATPFAVEQVIGLLYDHGELAYRGGCWTLGPAGRFGIPPLVRDSVLGRAGLLGPGRARGYAGRRGARAPCRRMADRHGSGPGIRASKKRVLHADRTRARGCSLRDGQDPESLVERVAGFDRDSLGEATRGHGPLIEKSDASKQHEAVALPAADEADLGSPLPVVRPGRVGGVQPQLNGLVACDYGSPADCVRGLTVVVFEVELELVCEQVAG